MEEDEVVKGESEQRGRERERDMDGEGENIRKAGVYFETAGCGCRLCIERIKAGTFVLLKFDSKFL